MPARASKRDPSLPPLVPEPRRSSPRPGHFVLRDEVPIVLDARGDGLGDRTAQRLREGVADRCQRHLAIEGHAQTDDLGPRIELSLRDDLGSAEPPGLRAQRYRLDVSGDRVVVSGGGAAGLRHGVETLLQLVDSKGRIPACRIDDAPDFERRGIMLDISRGKVPHEASLLELVDLCATLKLNVLMLYTEHTFRFRRHPEIGQGAGALDAALLRRLDAHAHRNGVELIPCLQSLGHMERILSLPAYRGLSETDLGWTLAPTVPGTYALLRDLYDEYLPNFRSTFFNANCDEPWDLGTGRSAERSDALGPGGLYLEHIDRIRDLATSRGKQMMIWADVVHAHPKRIPEIPSDLILMDWWYEAEFDYDRVSVFREIGLDFWVCPGTSTWNALFPRVENAEANISGWAEAGRRHGATGLLNTDWGDYGHYNLQGNSLLAYAWGAQESWSGRADTRRFDRAFSRLVFDDASGGIARLYRALGALHDPGFPIFNGSPLQFLFFEDVERGYFSDVTRPARLQKLETQLLALQPKLAAAVEETTRERQSLRELVYACDASSFAVRKAAAARESLAWRRGQLELNAAKRRRLARRLADLADEQSALGRRLRQLWLARAHPSNLQLTLARIRAAARSLRRAAKRLETNRPGKPPVREAFSQKGAIEELRRTLR